MLIFQPHPGRNCYCLIGRKIRTALSAPPTIYRFPAASGGQSIADLVGARIDLRLHRRSAITRIPRPTRPENRSAVRSGEGVRTRRNGGDNSSKKMFPNDRRPGR